MIRRKKRRDEGEGSREDGKFNLECGCIDKTKYKNKEIKKQNENLRKEKKNKT